MKNRKFGLSQKLISIYLAFAIIPTLFLGIFAYLTSYRVLWKNVMNATDQSVQQVETTVEEIFRKTEYFSGMAQDTSVKRYMSKETGTYKDSKDILSLFEIYIRNTDLETSIHNIYLLGESGKGISYRNGILSGTEIEDMQIPLEQKEIKITKENKNPNFFYENQEFIYVQIPLIMESLRDPYGQLIIEMKSNILQEFCDTAQIAENGYFTILDENGKEIFRPGRVKRNMDEAVLKRIDQDTKGSFIYDGTKPSLMITHDTIPKTDWVLVGQIPMQDLMTDAYEIRNTVFGAVGGIVCFAVLLYVYFLRRIILPIRQLNATMQIAALGDMEVRYQGKTKDEIGDLGESFNQMLEKIDLLASQNLKKQVSLQKAELDILQAQINPHFLYNTLDTIIWQAQAGNSETVIATTDALASFFRITLSKGKGWITVREEIEMLKSYLLIQKTRYGEILQYQFNIADTIMEYKMLKLILQPVAENAIYHGIKNSRSGGTLVIRGYEDAEFLCFEVEDDGVGILPDRLRELKEQLSQPILGTAPEKDGGFGLANVNGRIKLYYGEDCGLFIESKENVGTVVKIQLRKERGYV